MPVKYVQFHLTEYSSSSDTCLTFCIYFKLESTSPKSEDWSKLKHDGSDDLATDIIVDVITTIASRFKYTYNKTNSYSRKKRLSDMRRGDYKTDSFQLQCRIFPWQVSI
ncbi:protein SCAI [Platysternon megacephalum]|uniref:Protein SCAI n=1 Tax=Platysternon megacephalum TaxID=55544 RepID=A0A4D9EFI0_9SAUR|nr:protein SCAI [Platysternon megacephalum]